MKKIALFLTFALALSSVLTAADVSVGGWLETRGLVNVESGDGLSDDAKKPTLGTGPTTLDVTINVNGEGFGATATMETWLAGGQGFGDEIWIPLNDDKTAPANVDSLGFPKAQTIAPKFDMTWIWADFAGGMVTTYAGINAGFLTYAPAPLLEGGPRRNVGWDDGFFSDQLGMGSGHYNYQGGGATGKVTGFAVEVKPVAEFAAALAVNIPENGKGGKLENSNAIINAKYLTDAFDIYAGFSGKDDSVIWVAASVKTVPFLTADLKFESVLGDTDATKVSVISANLGYDLEMVSIKTKTSYQIKKDANNLDLGVSIAPMVPVVDLSAVFRLQTEEKPVEAWGQQKNYYSVGLNIGKSIGNVTNTLSVVYATHAWNENTSITAGYAANIWF